MTERVLRCFPGFGRVSLRSLALVGLIIQTSWTSAAENLNDPQILVASATTQLVESLQQHMQTVKTDTKLAHALANETVILHLDFGRISQLVLGKYWRGASTDQRLRFEEQFRKYLTRVYVSAMISYAEEIVSHADSVSYLPVRYRQDGGAAMVRSRLSLRAGQEVAVDYRLHKDQDGWKIYDVIIEGVSLAMAYRSSIAAEISRGGLDKVIDDLAHKTQ